MINAHVINSLEYHDLDSPYELQMLREVVNLTSKKFRDYFSHINRQKKLEVRHLKNNIVLGIPPELSSLY